MSYFYEELSENEHKWRVFFATNNGSTLLGTFKTKQEAIDHIHYLNGGAIKADPCYDQMSFLKLCAEYDKQKLQIHYLEKHIEGLKDE